MAIYNREDARTALPQIEKAIDSLETKITDTNKRIDDIEWFTYWHPTAYLCSLGTGNNCIKIGDLVFLSFNINITTSAIATAYLKNLPKPICNMACCSSTARFRVDKSGELVSEEAPPTGWHNGFVAYLCKEEY